jgi:hypothetical protein
MNKLFTTVTLFALLLCGNSWSQPAFEWVKNIGGTGTDVGTEITADADGNVIVCGRFETTVDSDPSAGVSNLVSAGSFDMVVIKFDSTGQFIWSKRVGGTGFDEFTNVECDASGNVILVGYFEGTVDLDPNAGVNSVTSQGTSDLYVMKLSPEGETLWMHEITGATDESTGGLSVTSTGHIFVSGGFNGTVNFSSSTSLTSAGENDAYVMKLNPDGTLNWVKQIGSTSFDYAYDVDTYTNGDLVVAGRFRDVVDFNPGAATSNGTSAGSNDGFIVRLNTNGDYIWHKSFGGTGFDEIWAVATDVNNNTFTYGFFSGTADLDPGAAALNFTSNGTDDLFIQKFNSVGNLLWAKTFGGSELENSYDIATDSEGNVVAIGDYFNTVDFDPGAGTFNMTSLGNNDIFMLQLDANGNFNWMQSIGSTFSQAGYALYIDNNNSILSTGTFSNNVDFNPGAGTTNINALLFNMYVLKLAGFCVLPALTSVVPSDQTVCEGETVTLSITGNLNGASSWAIHAGDCNGTAVTTTVSNTATITPIGGETYFIRGQGGCVTTGQSTCTEINLTTNASFAIFENATICPGENYTFPDGNSMVITETMSYESSLQTLAGCDSTITTSIDVVNLPTEIETTDSSIVILDFNAKSGVDIQWIDCNTNQPIAGENGPEFLFSGSGSFAVTLTNDNCTSTSDCFTVTDAQFIEVKNVEVYPNPFQNSFTIRGAEVGAVAFLYTADGRLISESLVTGHEVMVTELEELPAGIYILRISGKSGISNVKISKN